MPIPPTREEREIERDKYLRKYAADRRYRMSSARMQDAWEDIRWARSVGCNTMLDIGCGRGEMLDLGIREGFTVAHGTEIVPELCDDERVTMAMVNDLQDIVQGYDFVCCFDVIEHLIPGDDELLILEMARLSGAAMALTANNGPFICRISGDNLHINIKSYDEWDVFIRELLSPDWQVERCDQKDYVSETWRALR